jgi:hypothetical protein
VASRGRRWARIATAAVALSLLFSVAGAAAEVTQVGTLRVQIATQIKPYKLPRTERAPIKVLIAGHVSSTTGAVPPQLQRLSVLINRHGQIDPGALPSCGIGQIRSGSSVHALAICGRSLVGSGRFWASVVLPEQGVYHTSGRLLTFNGTLHGRPALLAQIFTTLPFPTSFVVPFSIRHVSVGSYGTELSAALPEALGSWGFVDRIKMTLGRIVHGPGGERSYLQASCPAARHAKVAAFSLARADFYFAGGTQLHATVPKSCGVRE